jgi:hypothetical protein
LIRPGLGDAPLACDHLRALRRVEPRRNRCDGTVAHQDVALRKIADVRLHREHEGAAHQ